MAAKGRKNRHRKSKLPTYNRVWLSDLPDDILICILSFLPTKESVATSILSKRWLNLWTSITKLDFCDDSYNREGSCQFINFVDWVMSQRDGSDLESFSLSCDYSWFINKWITAAVQCNIKELSLDLTNDVIGSNYILPSCTLFSCESLVKLELNIWFNIVVPSSISLPNLKYLKLKSINFENDESTEKLLSHPLLEELDIEWCNWFRVKSLTVNVPKLRVLKLHENRWEGRSELLDFVDRKVGFSGDNLEYFQFKGILVDEFYIRGCAMKLKEAEILENYVNPSEENLDILVKPCYKLLSGLSWVRNLTLTEGFLQILERTPQLFDRIPVFKCVTELNLKGYGVRIDSSIIMKIYERCPHLEHLTFMAMSNSVRGPLLHPIPSCFRTHLKRITIVNYQREFEEAKAHEVLLNSAPILKEMVLLYTVPLLCKEYEVKKLRAKLNERPKASKIVELSVVFDYN